MDPLAVSHALDDRAKRLARRLEARWGSVPRRDRAVTADVPTPSTPGDVPVWAAVCLVFDDHGRVLYLRDDSHGHLAWEPPGGRGELGEDPSETAAREVREETGVECEVTDLLLLDTLRWDYGTDERFPMLQTVFRARRTGGTAHAAESGIDEVRWFHSRTLPDGAQYRYLVVGD